MTRPRLIKKCEALDMVRDAFKVRPGWPGDSEAILCAALRHEWTDYTYVTRQEFAERLASVKALFEHVMGVKQ